MVEPARLVGPDADVSMGVCTVRMRGSERLTTQRAIVPEPVGRPKSAAVHDGGIELRVVRDLDAQPGVAQERGCDGRLGGARLDEYDATGPSHSAPRPRCGDEVEAVRPAVEGDLLLVVTRLCRHQLDLVGGDVRRVHGQYVDPAAQLLRQRVEQVALCTS